MIVLNWETRLLCSKRFASGKAMLDAFGIDHEDGITDQEAIGILYSEMETSALLGDMIEELSFDAAVAHSVEVVLDDAEALIVSDDGDEDG